MQKTSTSVDADLRAVLGQLTLLYAMLKEGTLSRDEFKREKDRLLADGSHTWIAEIPDEAIETLGPLIEQDKLGKLQGRVAMDVLDTLHRMGAMRRNRGRSEDRTIGSDIWR